MEYKVDDKALSAAEFIPFVNQVWPGDYDMDRTQAALSRTLTITAYDGKQLVGCLRILSDGYFFRHNHRAARSSLPPKAGDWQPVASARPGQRAHHAVFWFTAGKGSVL